MCVIQCTCVGSTLYVCHTVHMCTFYSVCVSHSAHACSSSAPPRPLDRLPVMADMYTHAYVRTYVRMCGAK